MSSGGERGVWVEEWAAFGSIGDLAVGFACTVWLAVLRVDTVPYSGYMWLHFFFFLRKCILEFALELLLLTPCLGLSSHTAFESIT